MLQALSHRDSIHDGLEAWVRSQNSAPETSTEIDIYFTLHGRFSEITGILPFVWQYYRGWGLMCRPSGLADVGCSALPVYLPHERTLTSLVPVTHSSQPTVDHIKNPLPPVGCR